VQLGRLVVHPGNSHPAEPVADQRAQNAIDMLAYPEGTGSPTTTRPPRARQTVRENLDYLERLLSPESVHIFGPTTVQPSHRVPLARLKAVIGAKSALSLSLSGR
jgi:hypothetical protein